MTAMLFEQDGDLEAARDGRHPEMSFAGAVSGAEIFNEGRYRAFVQDLECMWRWEIHRDGEFVQEGCSLSESSSREAVGHVISFFRQRDVRQTERDRPPI
jgi:soluble methane monooxygenase-binding protein MmoD